MSESFFRSHAGAVLTHRMSSQLPPSLPYFAHGSTTGATSLCLLRSLPWGGIKVAKSAWAECTIYANSLCLSLLSVCLCLTPSLSLFSQNYYFFLPLKTGEGFLAPLVSTLHVVFGSVLASPRRDIVTLPPSSIWLGVLQLPLPTDPTGKQVLPVATSIPNLSSPFLTFLWLTYLLPTPTPSLKKP